MNPAAYHARRTYNATLAELTSLEELMRTMMADGGVHVDVVNKLWQVYSESPRASGRYATLRPEPCGCKIVYAVHADDPRH